MPQNCSPEAAPDAISAAIRHLHTQLLASPLAPSMACVGAAEWWVHARDPTQPHQLHYDMDERFLGQGRSGYQLHHPVCCCFIQPERLRFYAACLIASRLSVCKPAGFACRLVSTCIMHSTTVAFRSLLVNIRCLPTLSCWAVHEGQQLMQRLVLFEPCSSHVGPQSHS